MKPNESWVPPPAAPERMVVVDEATYLELLVSRRHLERRWDRPTRLLDRHTRELFVHRAEAEGHSLDFR
jgi:hypothetical protein